MRSPDSQTARRIVLLYAAIASLWIFLSTRLLKPSASHPSRLSALQIYKGWAFVAVTTLLLYVLIQRELRMRKQAEEVLRRRHDFTVAVLDTVSALIVILDREGRIVRFNQACEKATHYTFEEVKGRYVWDLFLIPEEVEPVKAVFKALRAGQFPNEHENYWVTKDGRRRLIRWSNTALTDEQGLVEYVIGTGIDITERRQAEEALRQAHDELEQHVEERTREIERRRQVAEGLRDILAILNSNHPLDEVLEYIVAQASRLLNAEAGAVYRLQDEKGLLSLQVGRNLPTEGVAHAEIPVGGSREGQAVLERHPVACSALSTAWPGEEHATWWTYLGERYRSLLVVPLIIQDKVYGCLALYYADARTFSSEEVELAVTIGDQAILAIQNAQLRARAEESAVAAERSRLARELHDAVTQTLFSASVIAEVLPRLWERNPAEGRRRLDELRELTRGALAEMRTLLLELRPAVLTETALDDLLHQLAEAITGRARIPVTVTVKGQPVLPSDVQIALYRITQEALNNVARHAGASRATVSLDCQPGRIELRIVDDGRGFNSTHFSPEHLGLGIMRERAEAIGATLTIESRPGQGTEVAVVWLAGDEMQEEDL